MHSMRDIFSTETLILHKKDKTRSTVTALVDREEIHTDNVNVIIEEDDIFERTLPNGAKEYYRVADCGFYKGDYGIPDNYQCKVKKISRTIAEREISEQVISDKPHKLFISHSNKDADYIEAFVNLLEILGLREDEIICSSVPPYCIPLDNKVYDWLVNEFQQSDLHVIYALSDNYYGSCASLNEMGAAWAMKHKWTGILMPGFPFDKIDGCIDRTQISIKLDDRDKRTLNFRLEELKDNLTTEFGLRPMSSAVWQRKRDDFLDKINSLAALRVNDTEKITDTQQHRAVVGKDNVDNIPVDAAFLLVYAAEGNGRIIKLATLGAPPQISASGKQFMANNSHRESARWQEALDRLINWRWVRPVDLSGEIFELTGTGYKKADWLKKGMGIDTSVEPLEELKYFTNG